MGLNCSHGAWAGSYGAFNRLRQKVCEAMRGSFPPHEDNALDNCWYWGEGYSRESHPGLMEFLAHSDCDGEISPTMCIAVADELESLLPQIANLDIARAGGYEAAVRRFIRGCRLAAQRGEPLTFD